MHLSNCLFFFPSALPKNVIEEAIVVTQIPPWKKQFINALKKDRRKEINLQDNYNVSYKQLQDTKKDLWSMNNVFKEFSTFQLAVRCELWFKGYPDLQLKSSGLAPPNEKDIKIDFESNHGNLEEGHLLISLMACPPPIEQFVITIVGCSGWKEVGGANACQVFKYNNIQCLATILCQKERQKYKAPRQKLVKRKGKNYLMGALGSLKPTPL